MSKNKKSEWVSVVVLIVAAYFALSMIRYSLLNPDMTSTRKWMNMWELLTWQ